MSAGPFSTPRVGALGILSATGSMLYRDANGDVTDVVPGTNGQVLTLVAGVPDWMDASLSVNVFQAFTAKDGVFGAINGQTGIAGVAVRNKRSEFIFSDTAASAADNQNIVFESTIPTYFDAATKSLEVRLDWAAPVGILVGDVKWDVAWERDNILGLDIDTDSFAAAKSVTTTTSGVSGQLSRTTITFTSAEADGLLAGEDYRLQVVRAANAAGDTLVGNANLLYVSIVEV